jgi:hypothetical protein
MEDEFPTLLVNAADHDDAILLPSPDALDPAVLEVEELNITGVIEVFRATS